MDIFGVGKWREMREALLPEWEEAVLRAKAARALGCQSLGRYSGWKGDRWESGFESLKVYAPFLSQQQWIKEA